DGSAESLKAFDEAVRVAKRNDAELILANVIEKRSFLAVNTYDTIAEEQHENGTKLLLQQFAKEALDEGLTNVRTLLEYGSPKVVMATKIPKQENVDLIVIGATGISYIERVVVGSVASYIVNHATCNTLIVRK
ncbi:MAG: universal stress protein, partial [Lactococcus lactis]